VIAAAALPQLGSPNALAVDTTGSLYVADDGNGWRIQRRDTQGSWSVIATRGTGVDQVFAPSALAVDSAGNLYVAESSAWPGGPPRILKRDIQGNWSAIATDGDAPGQVNGPAALAVDSAGSLYVADGNRIQKRDAQGNWSEIATYGTDLGQVLSTSALAVDAAGNLYVADLILPRRSRIQKRDAQGNWSEIATIGDALGQVAYPRALAADSAGSLYVADEHGPDYNGRIQKRDAQGIWSVIATAGTAVGQIIFSVIGAGVAPGLAVDRAGNLYVADTGNNRVQEYAPNGSP
jgi:sugar lactone lactonase YvrE